MLISQQYLIVVARKNSLFWLRLLAKVNHLQPTLSTNWLTLDDLPYIVAVGNLPQARI